MQRYEDFVHVNTVISHPKAKAPVKSTDDEKAAGFNVSIVCRADNELQDSVGEVNVFDTGLIVTPPKGYYLTMHAQNSLYRLGYSLATGVTVIDPGCTGKLLVPLYKFKEGPDLEFPFPAVQLVLHKEIKTAFTLATKVNTNHRGAAKTKGSRKKPVVVAPEDSDNDDDGDDFFVS